MVEDFGPVSREDAVWLNGPRGRLLGIVHTPAAPVVPSTCLIMLNAGQINRAGPQRLYVRAARNWVEQGVFVLRLDFAGVGDSEPENTEIHFDNHSAAEVETAVRYAHQTLKAERVVLQGLCAGARVAFKAAANNSAVSGILAWNCPIFNSGDPAMPKSPDEDRHRMSMSGARREFQHVAGAFLKLKFLSPSWWRNRFQNSPSELTRLAQATVHFVHGTRPVRSPFLECADGYVAAGRNVLFVYAERDKLSLAEFLEKYSKLPQGTGQRQAYCVLADGTHNFNSIDEHRRLVQMVGEWLSKHYTGRSSVAPD